MSLSALIIRPAKITELDAINKVINSAVMGWNLPERVIRLSLPSYYYTAVDFEHFNILVAEQNNRIIGLSAIQTDELSLFNNSILLHGLYVMPEYQHAGIGKQLFKATEAFAKQQQRDGIIVKAQAGATDFFIKQGMEKLASDNTSRDYSNRYWKAVH